MMRAFLEGFREAHGAVDPLHQALRAFFTGFAEGPHIFFAPLRGAIQAARSVAVEGIAVH